MQKKSPQLNRKDYMEQFFKKREISLTKVSVRYNKLNMALRDMS